MIQHRDLEDLKIRIEALQDSVDKGKKDEKGMWCPHNEILGLLTSVRVHLDDNRHEKKAYQDAAHRLAAIETDIEHIREDVASLCRVVRDGNGQPSMLHRLTNLESIVNNSCDDITEIRGHATSIIAAKALSKSQVIAGLSGMVLTALLSSMALIATLLK